MKAFGFIKNIPKKITKKSFSDEELVFNVIKTRKFPSFQQIKYIGKFYSEKEMIITKAALSAALISALSLGIILYKEYITIQPDNGGEYIEAIIGAPTYINPLFAQTNDIDQDLSRLIFSSLMKVDESGKIIKDLAESYEISQDQKTYTFVLKPDILWHDKEPLTADDIIFTVQAMQDQNFKSPLYVTFRNIQIRKIDERRVSFTLTEPFAPFLSALTFGIIPEHLWIDIDPSHAILAELNLKPVGSGPYKFSSFTKDKKGNIKEYALERFKDYYSEGPYIDNISFKFFSGFEEAQNALIQGNADGIGFLPQQSIGSDISQMEKKGSIKINKLSLPQYAALFFNQASNPVLAEKAVRQALSLGTSKYQIINSVFPDFAQIVDSPILPGMIGYSDDLPKFLFDRAQAEKILDDAGWKRVYQANADQAQDSEAETKRIETSGSKNLGLSPEEKELYYREKKIKAADKENTALEITLTTIQRDEMIKIAEELRNMWQDIGVKVNVQIIETGKIQKDAIKPRAYEVLLFGQILGHDPDPYPFWHSSQANDPGINLALYYNKDVDRLLEDARRASDENIRKEKYIAFQKKLIEDIPAIFLYSLQYTYAVPSNIKGLATKSINHSSDRFSNVDSWYIKTKKRISF